MKTDHEKREGVEPSILLARSYMVQSVPKQTNMAAFSGARSPNFRLFRTNLRQKPKDNKEGSDSDEDDLFDGEKLKTRLMSMWNNMRHG